MKIALIGYGKMGKAIECFALEQGHTVIAKFNSNTPVDVRLLCCCGLHRLV